MLLVGSPLIHVGTKIKEAFAPHLVKQHKEPSDGYWRGREEMEYLS
jgi:hypothetical protein